MTQSPRASIIITNYNYGRFLPDSIGSALDQTYAETEVIVVDDGSTDSSSHVISGYEDRVHAVWNSHAGQAAGFNAGLRASTGAVVCFLDADDVLLPTAMEKAAAYFADPSVAKVHWPLCGIDEAGCRTGEIIPERALDEGDLRSAVLDKGPGGYVWSPTSGNAWARWFLDRIIPMPEQEYVTCADTYLSLWAPLCGVIKAEPTVQALYREHGENNRYRISHAHIRRFVEHSRNTLDDYLRDAGVTVDTRRWEAAFRWPDRDQALDEIASLLSPDESFILVDGGHFGEHFALADRALRLEGAHDPCVGKGAPMNVERLRGLGAGLVVIAWPAFHSCEWGVPQSADLCAGARCVLRNERVVVFDIRDRQA